METLIDFDDDEYSLGSQRSLLFSCPLSPSFFRRRKRSIKKVSSKTKEKKTNGENEKKKKQKDERPTLRRIKSTSSFFLSRVRSDISQGGDTVSSFKDNDDEKCYRLLEKAKQLDEFGNQCFQEDKLQDSLKSYKEALNLKRQILRLDDDSNSNIIGNSQKASSIIVSEGMKIKIQSSMATTINNIAFLCQRIGSGTTSDIMSVYEQSLKIKKKYLGNNHLNVGTTLNNIGSVYFSKKSYDKALIAYQQALDIMVLNLGNLHLDVATVYSNIGDVYFSTKKLGEAGISYDNALKIRWSELTSVENNIRKDPRIIRLLERISIIDMAKMTMEFEDIDIDDVRQYNSDDDDHFLDEDSYQKLKEDTKTSLHEIERIERKLELEMYRDKIKMAGDMRDISTSSDEWSEDEDEKTRRKNK